MNLSQLKIWACAASLVTAGALSAQAQGSHFNNHPGISVVASTVPANGDVNPYGIVRVPKSSGSLVAGNILISNFNSSANLQGTGTTIVQISPDGTTSLFAQIDANNLPGPCPGGVGLTTALAVLRAGWVIVGSLPTTDGTSATAQAGCLLVLDNMGNVVETFYGSLINGPWDMTWMDSGGSATLFVSNVLNGTVAGGGNVVHGGTVVRMTLGVTPKTPPSLQSMTVIGSGFSERTDPAALVIGPTGVGLDASADHALCSRQSQQSDCGHPASFDPRHLGWNRRDRHSGWYPQRPPWPDGFERRYPYRQRKQRVPGRNHTRRTTRLKRFCWTAAETRRELAPCSD